MPKDAYIVTLAASEKSPNRCVWLLRLKCQEHLQGASMSELRLLAVKAHTQTFGDSGLNVGYCEPEAYEEALPQNLGEPHVALDCGCLAWRMPFR
jgi:hypothetical protein